MYDAAMFSWIVSLPDRLDQFLAREGRISSRTKAQKAIEEGFVSVNDHVTEKAAMRLQEGDCVTLDPRALEIEPSMILPVRIDLPILYEDTTCFVIDKPAGIAVHPGAGMVPNETTLLSGLLHLFQERGLPFSEGSVLVHRLDKETTGCLLIAKNASAHAELQEQFESRVVTKTYLALVAGLPELREARIDSPVGRSTTHRTKMTVLGASAPREAQTTYHVLERSDDPPVALLACDLHTGRTHQIRVHLSSIGHPVLGDHSYTSDLSNRLSEELPVTFLCLHAWKLSFTSPADRKTHAVAAPVPKAFADLLKKLRMKAPGR